MFLIYSSEGRMWYQSVVYVAIHWTIRNGLIINNEWMSYMNASFMVEVFHHKFLPVDKSLEIEFPYWYEMSRVWIQISSFKLHILLCQCFSTEVMVNGFNELNRFRWLRYFPIVFILPEIHVYICNSFYFEIHEPNEAKYPCGEHHFHCLWYGHVY